MILPTAQLVAQTGQLCDAALESILHSMNQLMGGKKANKSFCALALGQYMFLLMVCVSTLFPHLLLTSFLLFALF